MQEITLFTYKLQRCHFVVLPFSCLNQVWDRPPASSSLKLKPAHLISAHIYIYRERALPCYTYTDTYTDTYNVYGVQEILSSFGHRPSASSKHPPNQSVTMTHFDMFVTYIHTNLNHHTIQITSKKYLRIYIYVHT